MAKDDFRLPELPPKEAPIVGGPFDGKSQYFNVEFWEPNEVRYHKLYEEGIIDDVTVFSKNFPEGAVYRWNQEEKNWKYIGLPDWKSREDAKKLFDFFNIEPEDEL